MSALDTCSMAPGGDPGAQSVPTRGRLLPAEIVPMVEGLLQAALERLDLEASAAHAEASAAVAVAVRRSQALILGRDAAAPEPGPAPLHMAAPVGPDVPGDDLGPDMGDRTPAQVYDLFWSEIPSDQPIRERLRRWAQRPPM